MRFDIPGQFSELESECVYETLFAIKKPALDSSVFAKLGYAWRKFCVHFARSPASSAENNIRGLSEDKQAIILRVFRANVNWTKTNQTLSTSFIRNILHLNLELDDFLKEDAKLICEISAKGSQILLKSVVESTVPPNADIDEYKTREKTPLMFAAEAGNIRTLSFLLEKGAAPTKQGQGRTPLEFAVGAHKDEAIKFLLEKGQGNLSNNNFLRTMKLRLEGIDKEDSQDKKSALASISMMLSYMNFKDEKVDITAMADLFETVSREKLSDILNLLLTKFGKGRRLIESTFQVIEERLSNSAKSFGNKFLDGKNSAEGRNNKLFLDIHLLNHTWNEERAKIVIENILDKISSDLLNLFLANDRNKTYLKSLDGQKFFDNAKEGAGRVFVRNLLKRLTNEGNGNG